MQHKSATLFERLIAAGSYLTLGTVGMIWFLLTFLVLKAPMSNYLMCNIVQSFVLSIFFAILTLAYQIFIGILVNLPFVGKLFLGGHNLLFSTPVFNTLSLFNYVLLLFVIYLSVVSLFGKLPYIPYITDIAKRMRG